jgi:hypothetical protein
MVKRKKGDEDGSNSGDDPDRTGIFTSGVVSTKAGRKIALFFTGRKHAGENLSDLLAERKAELERPIQMCDALSRNAPKELQVIIANCIAHARRKFVEVVENWPDECRYVLETLASVYKNDALARERKMSAEERLRFHQAESRPLMDELQVWMSEQLAGRKVEENSGLGGAISYALEHWEKLTRFLEVPGAPLDNNTVERALKKSIIHRNNSLFFKTEHGAQVGDIYMSLIYTCHLNGADPFDYLTELQRHCEELEANPQEWMPWNYRETLARIRARQAKSGEV